ncbi:hypothetical protein M9458_057976 [Cirrhinus mrigala]|uniref:Secreted protein n=1 Tax=Cirrhinus mrigala TaxID=683832 RepID=A0ABD0MD18_CIRMR
MAHVWLTAVILCCTWAKFNSLLGPELGQMSIAMWVRDCVTIRNPETLRDRPRPLVKWPQSRMARRTAEKRAKAAVSRMSGGISRSHGSCARNERANHPQKPAQRVLAATHKPAIVFVTEKDTQPERSPEGILSTAVEDRGTIVHSVSTRWKARMPV